MAKKRINITVNEETYSLVKNNISNVSNFVEDFLEIYVNSSNKTIENLQLKINIEEDKISKSLTKINILQKQLQKINRSVI